MNVECPRSRFDSRIRPDDSEEAFAELLHRHVDLVYSTAFRVLRNPSFAEQVTQRVFVALARNALKLHPRTALAGWLHETTRNFAITTVRSEERRRLREQEVGAMETSDSNDMQAGWDQMAPHLDDALAQVGDADRDAILLRYFERKHLGYARPEFRRSFPNAGGLPYLVRK